MSPGIQEDVPQRLLVEVFGLTRAEVARIDKGSPLARALDAEDNREIGLLGVFRVAITPEFYAHQLADIVSFKQGDAVLQVGTFGNPPDLDDVSALTFDAPDLRALRDCRVGDCDLQLPTEVIQRLQRDVDWRRRDASRAANGLIRQALVEYAERYRRSNAERQVTYADQRRLVDTAAAFQDLIATDATLRRFPRLRDQLFTFDAAVDQTGSTEFLYWSKERLGPKAVVTMTHLQITRPLSPHGIEYVAASKQIFASHYFDTSLGLTFLVGDSTVADPVTYVVYINRSQVDVFGGIFGGITRRLVRSRARSTLEQELHGLRTRLERRFVASGSQQ